MAEENENKRSFLEKLGDAGGGILNVAGRVGEGVVDGLAESRPLIGRPLQYGLNAAGFNTEGYQDRQDQRAKRKEELLAARKRNEVLDANLEQVDAVRLERGVAQNAQNLTRDLSRNPQFQGATPEELNGVMKSNAVVAELQKKFYVDYLMRVADGDTEAQGFLGRSLKKQGWDFRMPAKKGDPAYLILGKDSNGNEIKLPATRETIDRISQEITGRAANEINAQSRLLSAKSLGDPGRRAINRYVRALLSYNGRSAAAGERIVQGMINQASDPEKSIFACRQALIDYRDPNMPRDAKMAGLAKVEPYLQTFGFRAEYDPKNPDIENMRIIDMRDPEHFQSMTIHEFEEFLRQNDTLGMNLESRVQQIGDRYRQENRIKLANLNRDQIKQAANELNTGKGAKTAKGEAAGKSGTAENPVPTGEKIGKLAASYGDDVHTWSDDNIKKLSAMDKRINQYALSVGAIVKNDQGQYVLSGDTAAIRKVAEQFDKFTKASGIKNIGNPWEKYVGQSVDTDKKSLQDSTVPMARKNVERLYERHKEQLAKWGIGNLDEAIQYAKELPDPSVGSGMKGTGMIGPDLDKKKKILGDLLKAYRGWQRYSQLAK